MIAPPPLAERRTRSNGPHPRGTPPPSCPQHPGHRLGACAVCASGGVWDLMRAKSARSHEPPATTGAARSRRLAAVQAAAERVAAQRDAPSGVEAAGAILGAATAPEPGVAKKRAPKAGQPIRVKVAKAAKRAAPQPTGKPSKSGRPRPITYRGRTQTAQAWARELGLTAHAVRQRRSRGTPLDAVIVPRVPWQGERWNYERDCAREVGR